MTGPDLRKDSEPPTRPASDIAAGSAADATASTTADGGAGATTAPSTGAATASSTEASPGAGLSMAAADFSSDVGARNLREAFANYVQKVRGGDMGALPSILGLIVLVVIFSFVSSLFLSKNNFANLMTQAAPIALLAMGLVFVLLLGEIDLSAGTLSGVTAATMGLAVTRNGDLRQALGTGVYLIVLGTMLAAALVAAWYRIWIAAVVIVLGMAVMISTLDKYAVPAIFMSIAVGAAVGCLVGVLVGKVGIPSFIVTLALFLGWQGVLLKFIGTGNAIDARSNAFIFDLENSNLKPAVGWLLWVVSVGSYIAFTVWRCLRRRNSGLSAEPLSVVVLRGAVLAVISGAVVYVLNQNRSTNIFRTIEGVPKIVPIVVALLVVWTIVLAKTSFGRHLYAVGGNAEAARRAGIDVVRIKVCAFIISSGMAAVAGVALASRQGSIDTAFGGRNTLLYAVAAAVIGGTSLFGGKGKVRDAVIGGLVIAIIPNGLGLVANIDASYELIITAAVLLVAASVDALSRKRAAVA